jgi:phytoene synthase
VTTATATATDFEARDHVHHVVEASGTSFLQGMRLLPEERREGMFAVYAFCREIDDIADEPAPVADKMARLREWRREVDRLYEGKPRTLTGRALLPVVRDYGLDRADFLALIDGMEMDAVEDIRAPAMGRLELYCDRVAGAVGRLSIRIFGATEPHARTVARHLGQALQLTNILRDLGSDAARDRLYLPLEDLARFGVEVKALLRAARDGAAPRPAGLGALLEFETERARSHYAAAARLLPARDRRSLLAAEIMGAIYRAVLEAWVRRGRPLGAARTQLGKPRKLLIALGTVARVYWGP